MKKLFLIGVLLLSILVSHSAIITVSNTADSGVGSLRDAIGNANAGDTIQFNFSTPDSIIVASELVLDKDLFLIGPGADILNISGNLVTRILKINTGTNIFISGLTFNNGAVPNGSGGAILNEGGDITIEHSIFLDNNAFRGGAISNQIEDQSTGTNSKMTLNYCRFLSNRANSGGGAIYNMAINGDSSILELNYCHVSTNRSSGFGGGIQNIAEDTGVFGRGTAICRIQNSSITYNSSGFGGGISTGVGGPMQGGTARLILRNSTISENEGSSQGGGIYTFLTNFSPEISTLDIEGCTITNNKVTSVNGQGGGMYLGLSAGVGSPEFLMNNTILAGNRTRFPLTVYSDVDAELILNGNNLIGIGDRVLSLSSGIAGTLANPLDPKLCPLAFNGAATLTHALEMGSPAINRGDPATTLGTDQRDSARIGNPDIGAYEFNPDVVINQNITGVISQSTGAPLQNSWVFLIAFDKSDSSLSVLDSTLTDASGYYYLQGTSNSGVYVKAAPDSASYPMEMPTYFDSTLLFQDAIAIQPCSDSSGVWFSTIAGVNPGGPGFIGGKITQGANKKTGESLQGISILLVDSATQKVAAYVDTDVNGDFVFPNLALSSYEIWVDRPFIDNSLAPTFTLTSQDAELKNLKFELQSTLLEWVGVVDGIDPEQLWKEGTYSLYPNPANGSVSFKWEDNTFGEKVEIKMYDSMGKLVKQSYMNQPGEILIPLNDLSAGMYIYSVSHREEIKAIGKFVKR